MDREVDAKKIYGFLQSLDEAWHLGGALVKAFDPEMPFGDWIELVPASGLNSQGLPIADDFPDGVIGFEAFWLWLSEYVETHDFLRMSDFARAERVREEEQRLRQAEERLRDERAQQLADRQQALQESLEKFDTLAQQLEEDQVVQNILEGTYTLGGVEEEDGSAPVRHPHVPLLLEMLRQWGIQCQCDGTSWDGYALTAWEEWCSDVQLEEQQVSAAALTVFLDRERFRYHLEQATAAEDCGELLALLEREAKGEGGKRKPPVSKRASINTEKNIEEHTGGDPASEGQLSHPDSPGGDHSPMKKKDSVKAGGLQRGSKDGGTTRARKSRAEADDKKGRSSVKPGGGVRGSVRGRKSEQQPTG